MGPQEGILYGLAALLILCAPGLIARVKKSPRVNSIFILSVAGLGCAAFSPVIGGAIWLGSLIWALAGKKA